MSNEDPRRRCRRCLNIDRPKYPASRYVLGLAALAVVASPFVLGLGELLLYSVPVAVVLLLIAFTRVPRCRKCECTSLAPLSPQDSIAASAPPGPPQ